MLPEQLSKMLSTGVDLGKEYDTVSRTLESIGLSSYEARGYVALVAHGYGSAEAIAETARIPRTSAYKVLQSLCVKGFAISTKGRPTIFKPESPAKIKLKVTEHIAETFDRLEMLHEILLDKGEPQLVYTIAGRGRVLEKIGELLDSCQEAFLIATPTMHEIRETLAKKMDNAVGRNIRLTIITEPLQRVPEGAAVHWRKGLLATTIIADSERALLASRGLAASGYTDNANLAKYLESFLQILMDQPPTKP